MEYNTSNYKHKRMRYLNSVFHISVLEYCFYDLNKVLSACTCTSLRTAERQINIYVEESVYFQNVCGENSLRKKVLSLLA